MCAGVEGVRGARQGSDVDLVIMYGFGDIPKQIAKAHAT